MRCCRRGGTRTIAARSKQIGFSLIELLVVVAIIGLLLSVVVPVLDKARTRVQYMTCQAQQKQLGICFEMFSTENNNKLPSSHRGWAHTLMPYYESMEEVLLCPLAKDEGGNGVSHTFSAYSFSSVSEDGPAKGSYGINAWICNIPDSQGATFGISASNAWKQTDSISVSPSSIPLLLDSMWMSAHPDNTNLPPEKDGDFNGCDLGGKGTRQIRHFCIDRHEGSINGLFMDISVRKVQLKELWRLKWHRGSNTNIPAPIWPRWMTVLEE